MSERIVQINGLLRKEISNILLKGEGFDRDTLITITRVETTIDLAEAKVFVSVMPAKKSEEIMDFLQKNIYYIQQKLNKKLSIKRVPKIIFYTEKKVAQAGRIEEIIEKIHKEE
jgi:ribosome-binding factor A